MHAWRRRALLRDLAPLKLVIPVLHGSHGIVVRAAGHGEGKQACHA